MFLHVFYKWKPTSTPIAGGRGVGEGGLFFENAGRLEHIEADSPKEKKRKKANLDLTE